MLRTGGFGHIILEPYFMDGVDLHDWLEKVSKDKDTYAKAMWMHTNVDEHFRKVYEVNDGPTRSYTMTWRFAVISGVKPLH